MGRKPGPSGTPQNGGRPGKLRKAGHVGASIKASATTREAGSAPQAKATPKSAFVSHKLGTSTSTSAHGNVNGHSTSGPSRNPLDKDPSITEAARSSKIYVPATTSHAAQQKQLSNATISPTTNLATGNSGIQQSSVSFKPYRKRYSETSSHRVMEKRQNMPWFSSLLNTGDTPRRSESSVTIDGII